MTQSPPLPADQPLPAADGNCAAQAAGQRDIAALAKGGRTNFFGFLLRLAARLPFLFIAGRLYGAAALGRFASALVIIELTCQLCTLGQKRGIAQRLAEEARHDAHVVADGLVLSGLFAIAVSVVLWFIPEPMFPAGHFTQLDRLLPLSILPYTLTEIALAALAYRFDVGATVKSRSVVEPWTLSIAAGAFYYISPDSGLSLSYIVSIYAAAAAALWPLLRSYGWPSQWRAHPLRIARLAIDTAPLAVADAVEWGTRRLDIAILGIFATPTSVGVYYVAQQVASLPQKLKTSFEPILGPVIARNLKIQNHAAIAAQVCQVGFWITAAQAGIGLALGIPGGGVLGLVGPQFVGGLGALAFLLGAEVGAATSVVSEAALIYIAPMPNLWISVGTIVLQAGLTVAGMWIDRSFALDEMDAAASAAGALMVTLSIASIVKSRLLAHYLKTAITTWRWPLVLASALASLVGLLACDALPEWAELAFGIPAILGVYCLVIWHFGFGPEDRLLFRRDAARPRQVA